MMSRTKVLKGFSISKEVFPYLC